MNCKKCGTENLAEANFCRKCGAKLREVCDCWIKKEPYNCGQGKCPGYGLFRLERGEANEIVCKSDDGGV